MGWLKVKWIRWLGIIASFVVLTILVFKRVFLGTQPDTIEVLLFLILFILPVFATVFLSALARFWWTFFLGLWLLFLSIMFCIDEKASPISLALFLSAATICMTPFLNKASITKGTSINKNEEGEKPGIG